MKMPDAFEHDRIPPIVRNSFRADVHEAVMRILWVAQNAEHPVGDDEKITDETPRAFTVSDCREQVFEKMHRISYIINRLEDMELITSVGTSSTMQGNPKLYVTTELFDETIGRVDNYAVNYKLEESEGTYGTVGNFTTVFRNHYSGTNLNVNVLMSILERQNATTQKSKVAGAIIGLLGIEAEYDSIIVEPHKIKAWLDDYIKYLENFVKILHQLRESVYLKGGTHGMRDARKEIWTPVRVDGSVETRERETGLTTQEYFEALDYLIHDAKAQEVFGKLNLDMLATVVNNLRDKVDTKEDVA